MLFFADVVVVVDFEALLSIGFFRPEPLVVGERLFYFFEVQKEKQGKS